MQVARFNFYTHIGLIVVHGSMQAVYLVKDDEIRDEKNFTQFQPDRIVLCMIVNGSEVATLNRTHNLKYSETLLSC